MSLSRQGRRSTTAALKEGRGRRLWVQTQQTHLMQSSSTFRRRTGQHLRGRALVSGATDSGVDELAAGRKQVDTCIRSQGGLFWHTDGSRSPVRNAAADLDFRYEESVQGHTQVLALRLVKRGSTLHVTIHETHGQAAVSFTSAAIPAHEPPGRFLCAAISWKASVH